MDDHFLGFDGNDARQGICKGILYIRYNYLMVGLPFGLIHCLFF